MVTWANLGQWTLDFVWLLLLFILLNHFWQKRTDLASAQSWLKVKGRIISCEWTAVGHSVWPKIEYIYQVHERELTGEYLFLDTSHNNPHSQYARNMAHKAALAFKENTEIDIYYNPNRPEQSALDVTIPVKLNVILIAMSSLILLHVSIIISRFI